MLRRHPLLFALISLLFTAFLAVAVFIATFDLNRYRIQVQDNLADALARPVTLSDAHLSLRHGISLVFTDLAIPQATGSSWSMEADRLFLKLEFRPLLQGRIVFSEILLNRPRLRLTWSPADSSPVLPSLPGSFAGRVGTLTILDGTAEVEDRRDPENPLPIALEAIKARLLDYAPNQSAWLTLSARLRQKERPAQIEMAGQITPAGDWRQTAVRIGLKITDLESMPLTHYAKPVVESAGGTLSLALDLAGSPATGLQVNADLVGKELTAALPGWYRQPIRIQRARFSATWSEGEKGHLLKNIATDVDGLACHGNLLWRRQTQGLWLEMDLATPPLPLPALLPLIPDRHPSTANWRGPLAEGTLQVDMLHFAGFAADLLSPGGDSHLQARFSARGINRQAASSHFSNLSLTATLNDDLLEIDGDGELLRAPVRFSGTVERPFSSRPEITAEAEGTIAADRLLAAIPNWSSPQLAVAGPIPLTLSLTGSPERLLADLHADLIKANASWGNALNKPAGLPASLFVTGAITPKRLELSLARLRFSPFELRARGDLERGGEQAFSLFLDLSGSDLKAAQVRLPLLARLRARGAVDVHYQLSGAGRQIRQAQGKARLRDIGLHFGTVIADLRQANGLLLLTGNRLEIKQLSAFLGTSPVTLSGSVADFAKPQADLRIRGRAVRANDLIFHSGQIMLRDLDGHLLIDGGGIEFAPATVRLDGGTRAIVRGTVKLVPQPEANLDIEAEKADIDKVIALWNGPPPRPATNRGKSGVTAQIRVRVGDGTLHGLHFRQAEGEIRYRRGVLTILPLSFWVGPGNCQGRVVVESDGAAPPMLRISGHMENVDAAAIYHDLLKKQGLITGALRGDFYLEGRAGREFLPTSLGGFSMEVSQGVLRKFQVLGKVFSLLNISQIFALRLPDMALEGMPFNRLSGNFALHRGILSTEDLFLDGNAMNLSLVGQTDLKTGQQDFLLGVKPLRTVDKIITRIPIAGWILAGEDKALITAHFHITGSADNPEVIPVPITSVSKKVLGIFRRVLGLPGKMIDDPEGLVR